MASKIQRLNVYKYIKSGKVVAVRRHPNTKGLIILDLVPDYKKIQRVRGVNYIKSDTIKPTEYILEVIENVSKESNRENSFAYQYIRLLTERDIDESRWRETTFLNDLPVSPHGLITKEERIWAGERQGNWFKGISLALFTVSLWYLGAVYIENDSIGWSCLVLACIFSFFLIKYKWEKASKPDPFKIEELKIYKRKVQQKAQNKQSRIRTELEDRLKEFSNWETLSPKQFEHALALMMNKDGFKVKTTKYIGDGGVDLEGTNEKGDPIIIQAKRYSNNVGVAVIREMIGIRESHPNKPLTMVVALVGFTRGAVKLAEKERIILKSIKDDIIKMH